MKTRELDWYYANGNIDINDRPPNFYSDDGSFNLVVCYACGGRYGKKNWRPKVATGQCEWCGWRRDTKKV